MSRTDGLLAADATLLARLEAAAPGAVAARASDRLSFAHDASHHLLVPDAVVTPKDAAQVAELLRVSAAHGLSLTFRSGGTSLSGQATNDGVLVDTRRTFRGIEILDDGARVRVQPGATVRSVNTRLARYGRKLGPDPASESACTVGGVVASNSSGMACGTALNTSRTPEPAVLVLPSGTVIDTGAPDADDRLRTLEPRIHQGLARLRDRVRGNPASVATISRLYAIKNTMGCGVNSFVDHTRPADILTHLVIGGEGTLAFVAEATFRTVPAHPHAVTGLLLLPDLAAATGALPELVAAGFATIELLDATSLRGARQDPAVTAVLRETEVRDHTALLVEHQEPTAEALRERVTETDPVLAALPLTTAGTLTTEPATRAALEGVGGGRPARGRCHPGHGRRAHRRAGRARGSARRRDSRREGPARHGDRSRLVPGPSARRDAAAPQDRRVRGGGVLPRLRLDAVRTRHRTDGPRRQGRLPDPVRAGRDRRPGARAARLTLLRHTVEVEGTERRPRRDAGAGHPRTSVGDGQRSTACRGRRGLLHRWTDAPPRDRGDRRRGHGGVRRREGPAAAARRAAYPLTRRPSHLRLDTTRSRPGTAARGRRGRRGRHPAGGTGLLRLRRGPGTAASGADGLRDRGRVPLPPHRARDGPCLCEPDLRTRHDAGDRTPLPAPARSPRRSHPPEPRLAQGSSMRTLTSQATGES